MQGQEMKLVIKILGIIGVIFCILALLLPWGGGAYTFGADFGFQWSIFYIDFFTSGVGQAIFFGIAMIIIFILTLITFILGLLAIKNFDTLLSNKFLTLGILCIVNFILYIIAVNVITGGYQLAAAYSIGFVFILISAILFFVAYFMHKTYITPMPMMQQPAYQQQYYQQPAYQQPAYQQPPPPAQPVPQPVPVPVQQPEPPQEKPKPKKQAKAAMNFCPGCGNKLTAGIKFCPNCGNKIS